MSTQKADSLGSAASRRDFLKVLLAGGGVLAIAGCGYYSPEQGEAYAPWKFPLAGEDRQLALVHAALLAASPHNTQPWLFRVQPGSIHVHADTTRGLGAMDPLLREMHIGLGCALENLVIAARQTGFTPTVGYFPDPTDTSLVAVVTLVSATPLTDPLFSVIADRRTNRGSFGDFPLDPRIAAKLAQLAADEPAVMLDVLTSAEQKLAFRNGTISATQRINDDSDMAAASHSWFRYTQDEITKYRDGLTLDAQDLSGLTAFLAKTVGPTDQKSDGDYWLTFTKQQTAAVSAFVILSTAQVQDREQALRTGRIYQRFHLWATSEGVAMQPLNQMAERRDRELELGLATEFGDQLEALVPPGRNAQMLFRLGYAWDQPYHSPRRPVGWVVES